MLPYVAPGCSPIFQSLVCCSIAITPSSMLKVSPHSLHFRLNQKLLLHYNQGNLFFFNELDIIPCSWIFFTYSRDGFL